jgi:hypothetical protein
MPYRDDPHVLAAVGHHRRPASAVDLSNHHPLGSSVVRTGTSTRLVSRQMDCAAVKVGAMLGQVRCALGWIELELKHV